MPLNPFFLHGSSGEQGLVQDLVNEHIKMFGIEIYYIPRIFVNEKTILEEVSRSEFTVAIPIEAYVDTYEGFGGAGTLLSKFGVQEVDDLTLIISKERYELGIRPIIEPIENTKLTERPKEGDLIYFPLGDKLFEIKYVEHEKPFYQLQKNYVYELKCELYVYNDEIIATGVDEIDDNIEEEGFLQKLQMVGVGTTATAFTGLVDGAIRTVSISNRGSGYFESPRVAITSAPDNGLTAVGIASMISGIVDLCDTSEESLRVQAVDIINPGYGYTVTPRITFTGGGGSGAYGVCKIANNAVGVVTITGGGSGYYEAPNVTFVGAGLTGFIPAVASALISESGIVTSIVIHDSGNNYAEVPTVVIDPPDVVIGTGKFIFNEVVVGSANSSTARVKSWDTINKVLTLGNILGTFIDGEILTGSESGARYTILNNDIEIEDKFKQNKTIEIEADKILDFSESNPFGNP